MADYNEVMNKLNYLEDTKQLLKTAIEKSSNTTIPEEETFRNYPNYLTGSGSEMFAFEIDDDGNLWCKSNISSTTKVPYSIVDGELIVETRDDDIAEYKIVDNNLEVSF